MSPMRGLVWAGKDFLRVSTGCQPCQPIIICLGGGLHLLASLTAGTIKAAFLDKYYHAMIPSMYVAM